ncbi:MAG TPA: PE family protein [Mycobacterium sp.]|uniref:PE family protein n=1 Tax=Mycobacterium sp. TaxID=1785 RepID=UPI002B68C41B|nr:PE family protein [Mycobacterium sp.]HME78831.1 PE family protein [Mycobacterium sp.]
MFLSSFVTTHPEVLSSAASDLAGIGSAMTAANDAASAPTGGVVPAAADEVSALTAAQFAAHAGSYQAISAAADAIHSLLVSTLQTNAASYAATEVANAIAAG